jgi:arginine N-succinyltransferase
MLVIRPVTSSDLEQFFGLAELTGVGLTNLPKDRELLSKRIRQSEAAFAHIPDHPHGESYLFVMEDPEAGKIVGASGIMSKVGGYQPFYEYKIETQLFESKIINVRKEVPILMLVTEHDGPAEVGSLFLHPDYRKDRNGRFLQSVRFLFMAERPQAFEPTVVSEIRGVLDEQGHSPFWDALGRNFFGIDFAEADRLSVVNKKFIADLMPRHPIYVPLLPKSAQAVIGQPHPESARAIKNLETEGFKFANMVDIFDAGPVYSCMRDEIRTVAKSRRAGVVEISDSIEGAGSYMVCTTNGVFRAVKGLAKETAGGMILSSAVAQALNVSRGDVLRYIEFDVT